MLYCPDVNSNLAPLGKVYLITGNKGPGYTAFHSMPHIYMRRFLATLFNRSGQFTVKKVLKKGKKKGGVKRDVKRVVTSGKR